MMSQTSQLVKLPRELLDNVTSSLPTQDFNALRLACKELETQLWEYWANCFFKKRQFSKQAHLSSLPTMLLSAKCHVLTHCSD